MERKEIYSLIEKNYNSSEKGKNFIIHLIRSFFPIDRASYVLDKPDNKELVCCITGKKLISKLEILALNMEMGEEYMKFMQEAMKHSLDKDGEKKEAPEHPLKSKMEGRVLAIGCEKSTKFLCREAWEELYNFLATETLKNNKNIIWVLKNERGNAAIKQMKKANIIQNQNEEKAVYKNINTPKKVTFGDLEVLKNLKNKLESQEKEKA